MMDMIDIQGVLYAVKRHKNGDLTLSPLKPIDRKVSIRDFTLDELMDEMMRKNEEEIERRNAHGRF